MLSLHIDPAHHLHVNKMTHGAHLHVTPNPKYSRAIASWIDAHREMHVVTTSHKYIGTCIDSITHHCFKLNLEDPSYVTTTYAAMHCSMFSMLTTDVALMWRQFVVM